MKTQPCILVITFALFLTGCNHRVSYQDALNENLEDFAGKKEMRDASSIVEIESLNSLALDLFQLATDTGYSSLVVNFAVNFKADHLQLQADISALAGKEKIALPDLLSAPHGEMLLRIQSASRDDFDRAFVTSIRTVNDSLLSHFTRLATQGVDADIRAFTARRLDILKDHQRSIDSIGESLLHTSR